MKNLLIALFALILSCASATAQDTPVQDLLQEHRALIEKSSRKTIGPAIDALARSGLPQMQTVLEAWQAKEIWQRQADGIFFRATEIDRTTLNLFDLDSGADLGPTPDEDFKQLKPNSGIRGMIGTALVQFQLSDPDPAKRRDALIAIERDPEASLLAPLRASIDSEQDAAIAAQKRRLERLLTIGYDEDSAARIAAINDMAGDLGLDVRATLNPLTSSKIMVVSGDVPADWNVAETLKPGSEDLPAAEAYALLVAGGDALPRIDDDDIRAALIANIQGGSVGGVPVHELDSDAARLTAYAALAEAGVVPATATDADIDDRLAEYTFVRVYDETDPALTAAVEEALKAIEVKVGLNQTLDLTLDALSLASIYFLAAIGLAITFGVMGVINMAHGEFIMMGAYTGYVVQQFVPNHTLSIIVAIPLAFAVTFAAGVLMERLVIRWLYNRPLETLLATFGISIALQQLAKNIFGTQARPLTSPAWLDGSWVMNDIVSISYIRIAIFVLALIFLCVFLFIMKRTRLGLETRAVTQNPRMAASMGINPNRVNMLTFGLGSGIAGIAGVAIGLFAKVTSELGSDYIVQSFMTVVVGGVGNIWGTLAGAAMIGFLQKGIEWFNPSNTLAAQTYMIIFIIIFIQFRPRGIIALKGRAAGD
ncbi:MAG: urea ABC transporter permease subunit UrtB [Pseudomonadota bacterium]|jgi:urea transport system permease protein|nr:urea ABC transporter permease subunit UrtB [Pseudomonadota bacterium]